MVRKQKNTAKGRTPPTQLSQKDSGWVTGSEPVESPIEDVFELAEGSVPLGDESEEDSSETENIISFDGLDRPTKNKSPTEARNEMGQVIEVEQKTHKKEMNFKERLRDKYKNVFGKPKEREGELEFCIDGDFLISDGVAYNLDDIAGVVKESRDESGHWELSFDHYQGRVETKRGRSVGAWESHYVNPVSDEQIRELEDALKPYDKKVHMAKVTWIDRLIKFCSGQMQRVVNKSN